jgi:hypothetical protein
MSNWYIQIDEQGNPVNHPLLEENLIDIYPNGIPSQYQTFNRMPVPTLNVFQNAGHPPTYEKINGVWQDVWPVTFKTDEEINLIKANIDQSVADIKTARTSKVNTLIADPITTDAQKIAYNNYLAQLQDYTVTDYLNWEVPKIPKLDSNGNIIS